MGACRSVRACAGVAVREGPRMGFASFLSCVLRNARGTPRGARATRPRGRMRAGVSRRALGLRRVLRICALLACPGALARPAGVLPWVLIAMGNRRARAGRNASGPGPGVPSGARMRAHGASEGACPSVRASPFVRFEPRGDRLPPPLFRARLKGPASLVAVRALARVSRPRSGRMRARQGARSVCPRVALLLCASFVLCHLTARANEPPRAPRAAF